MIVNPEIERYLLEGLPARDAVLAEMEEQAARRDIPIVGPVVGNLLGILARISGAKRIFELGSAIGYSTLWLALGAGPDAEVHYTDSSAERAEEARGYFKRAGETSRIRVHIGDAIEAMNSVPGEFDLIFCDLDKTSYPQVLDLVPVRIRSGGILVADNVLWRGTVARPQDESGRAIAEFNSKLFAGSELWSSIVPVRDGLSISVRR